MKDKKFDGTRFIIHFVFGIIFGFAAFLLIGLMNPGIGGPWSSLYMYIVFPIIIGLVGGFFGDRFWVWFCGLFKWLW